MGPRALAGALSRKLTGVFYGWRIVAISFVVNALATGTYFLGFSVFFLPISRDLDLSRTATSLPFALSRIVGGVMGPVVGVWIDRLGSNKVMAASALLGGLGFILLWPVHSYALFLLVFLGLLTVGMQGGFDASTSTAVTQWFVKRRGLAMAVSQTGYSIGGGIIPPLLALGVRTLDWRLTAMLVGIGVWAIALPLSTQLRRSPESMGLQPYGLSPSNRESSSTAVTTEPVPASQEVPLRKALRTSTYWLLALSFAFRATVWAGLAVHLVAIMVWKGLPESTSGYLVGLYAFAWTPAVLLMGWMGDRWPKQRLAATGSFIATIGLLLLLLWNQMEVWQMALALVLLAPNEAGWALGWAMVGDFFGRRNFATLRGGMIAVGSLMSVGAPLFAGWIYDTTNAYFWVILPAIILVGLAGLIVWFLPIPRLPRASPGG